MNTNDDKKHIATPAKRKRVRAEGHFPVSREVPSALGLLVAAGLLWGWGPYLFAGMRNLLADSLSQPLSEPEHLMGELQSQLLGAMWLVLPILAGSWFMYLISSWCQSSFHFSFSRIQIDLSRLLPHKGLAKSANISAPLQSSFRIVLLSGIIFVLLMQRFPIDAQSHESGFERSAAQNWQFLLEAVLSLGLATVALAAVDYFVQWRRYENELRMTDEELRQELKDSGGTGQLAGRRKQLYESWSTPPQHENI